MTDTVAPPGSKRMEETIQLYPHILPDLEDWPIHQLSLDRRQFVESVSQFTLDKLEEKYEGDFADILAKTIYQERIRIREKPWRVDPPNEGAFWKRIRQKQEQLSNESDAQIIYEEQRGMLYQIIDRYSEEIVGSFVPKTYLQARKILTALFKRLLTKHAKNGKGWGKKEQLYHRIKIYGPIEKIRQLASIGTVVIVPTHFSNLDSLLIGYAVDAKVGLPSFSWGAGLNLYNFGPAAYFMNRLGAYRVDRRKKNPVYLETLKSVSNLSIQRGTHTLFFPGGTRSRSGKAEKKVKLGLLSTVLEAQRAICEQEIDNKVFVVPLILDYHFVLEARYLIEQHLRSIGKERYMSIRDDSKSKRKLLRFLIQYYNESSEIVMSFGRPFDVLGNFVDDQGTSYDEHHREVRIQDYFKSNQVVGKNLQRESVYTRLLSDRIVERFYRDNVVLTSHVVAFTAFQLLIKSHPKLDIFGILKLPFEDFRIAHSDFREQVALVVSKLQELSRREEVRLSDPLHWELDELISDGIKKLGIYHAKKPLKLDREGYVTTENFKLLYYYHNRLDGYQLEQVVRAPMPAYGTVSAT